MPGISQITEPSNDLEAWVTRKPGEPFMVGVSMPGCDSRSMLPLEALAFANLLRDAHLLAMELELGEIIRPVVAS